MAADIRDRIDNSLNLKDGSEDTEERNTEGESLTDQKLKDLDCRETCLAKQLLKDQGKDHQRDSVILKEMGDVFRERGVISRITHNFVYASSLYNAALLRTSKKANVMELDALIRQNELAFCKVLSLTPEKMPSDFKADVKQRLTKIREICKAKSEAVLGEIQDQFDLDAPEQVRLDVEADFIQKSQELMADVCGDIKEFFRSIVLNAKEILGETRSEYAALGLGSLARGESTPYSDIEWGILIEEGGSDKEYFRNLTRMVHFFVLNIGETLLKTMYIKSLNDYATPGGNWFDDTVAPRGFMFDSACPNACHTPLGRPDRPDKEGMELIRTPQEMAQLCEYYTALKEEGNIDRVMTSTVVIDGSSNSKSLDDTFRTHRDVHRDEINIQKKTFKEIQELVLQFGQKLQFHAYGSRTVNDVKQDLYRLPTLVISLCKTLFILSADSTWDVLDEMVVKGKITEQASHNLKFVVSLVSVLRLVTYSDKSQQNELMSILAGHLPTKNDKVSFNAITHLHKTSQLIIRYYYTMLPFKKYIKEADFSTVLRDGIPGTCFETNRYYAGMIYKKALRFLDARECFFAEMKRHQISSQDDGDSVASFIHNGNEFKCSGKKKHIINCVEEIGRTYQCEEQYDKALEYYLRARDMYLSADNEEDAPDLAACLSNIAAVYVEFSDFVTALEFYKKSNQVVANLSSECPSLIIHNLLGMAAHKYELSQVDEALSIYKHVYNTYLELKKEIKKTGWDELKWLAISAESCYRIFLIYVSKGDIQNTIKYGTEALSTYRRLHGDNAHPQTADCLSSLGNAYLTLKLDPIKALEYSKEAFEMHVRIYGDNHYSLSTPLINYADALVDDGKLDLAFEMANKSLDIAKRTRSGDHIDICGALRVKAKCFRRLRQPREAVKCLKEGLAMNARIFGNSDIMSTTDVLFELGLAYFVINEFDLAIKRLTESMRMTQRIFGKDHESAAACLHQIAKVYSMMGKLEISLYYQREAYNMYRRIYGDNGHPGVKICLLNIALTYFEYTKRLANSGKSSSSILEQGEAYYKEGKYELAAEQYMQYIDRYQSQIGRQQPSREEAQSLATVCNQLLLCQKKMGNVTLSDVIV